MKHEIPDTPIVRGSGMTYLLLATGRYSVMTCLWLPSSFSRPSGWSSSRSLGIRTSAERSYGFTSLRYSL